MAAFTAWVLRYKLVIVLAWTAILLAGIAAVGPAAASLTGASSYPGLESVETNERIVREYGGGGHGDPIVPVVTLPGRTTVDSPGVRQQLDRTFQAVADVGLRAVSWSNTGDRAFVSADGRTVFGLVFTVYCEHGSSDCAEADATRVEQAMRSHLPAGSELGITGLDLLSVTPADAAEEESTLTDTLIAAVGALVILLFVFGSVLAVLPLLIAAVCILTAFLALLGVTAFVDVASIVEYVIAFIGLAVAVDYALLFTTRWREERSRGCGSEEAVVRTMATAGRAIVASGGTVALGLVFLLAVPNPGVRSLAVGGVFVPAFGVLVTMTLLPAILARVGHRMEWPRLRRERHAGRLWSRWAGAVERRPWWAVAGAALVLVPLCLAGLTIRIGTADSTAMPGQGAARTTLDDLGRAGVPAGVITPIEVLVPGRGDPAEVARTLSRVDGVRAAPAPADPAWRRAGSALVVVLPEAESATPEGQATIDRVTSTVHERHPGATVGGAGAASKEKIAALYDGFPWVLAGVVLVSFVLLTRTFRSPVLALQAVVLNLLSLAGAYGALVLVWQEGYGSSLLWSVPALGAVDDLAPLITFGFLFGLSMDFEVFLLSRIREEYARTGDTRVAVVAGLGRIGRLITSAALIMFLAFVAMSSLPSIPAKMMATGLVAAILLDATILRGVLAPALITLSGRWTWWIPAWAARLLRVPPTPATHEHGL